MDAIDSIVGRLEDISAELNDLAMSLISDALESGATERPAIEKRVSQARRSVDKAVHHLRHG